jgi:predicted solute-binding protein
MTPQQISEEIKKEKKLFLYPELVRALEKAMENRKAIIDYHIQHSQDFLGEETAKEIFKDDKQLQYFTALLNKVKEIEQ